MGWVKISFIGCACTMHVLWARSDMDVVGESSKEVDDQNGNH